MGRIASHNTLGAQAIWIWARCPLGYRPIRVGWLSGYRAIGLSGYRAIGLSGHWAEHKIGRMRLSVAKRGRVTNAACDISPSQPAVAWTARALWAAQHRTRCDPILVPYLAAITHVRQIGAWLL